jgi:hypothetical protein
VSLLYILMDEWMMNDCFNYLFIMVDCLHDHKKFLVALLRCTLWWINMTLTLTSTAASHSVSETDELPYCVFSSQLGPAQARTRTEWHCHREGRCCWWSVIRFVRRHSQQIDLVCWHAGISSSSRHPQRGPSQDLAYIISLLIWP